MCLVGDLGSHVVHLEGKERHNLQQQKTKVDDICDQVKCVSWEWLKAKIQEFKVGLYNWNLNLTEGMRLTG